jgi:hypothetical protein
MVLGGWGCRMLARAATERYSTALERDGRIGADGPEKRRSTLLAAPDEKTDILQEGSGHLTDDSWPPLTTICS